MLSDALANFALSRARIWMNRHLAAEKAGDTATAEIALARCEDWDDVRLWVDGFGTWSELRQRRRATRERKGRLAEPAVVIDIDGLAP